MTPADALRHGSASLEAAGIERPRFEARLLLAHLLGITQETLLAGPGVTVDAAAYDTMLARRAAREPLAFITGRREFWSLPFAVSPATLIPRPDSETLLTAAIAACPARDAVASILDLGTGTGCLLLAALGEFPAAFGVGVDVVPEAAALASRNAASLGLADRAAFAAGNWDAALSGRFDLILCNPPYIETADILGLMPEVGRHEPATALNGGADGLDAYRRLIPALDRLLTDAGVAVFEIGFNQEAAVSALAGCHRLWRDVRYDLGGIGRAVVFRKARSWKKPFGSAATGG